MKIVGSKKWCIRHKGDWEEYVTKKKKQFIIVNFEYFPDYDHYMVSFTVNKHWEVRYAYDSGNDKYKKDKLSKYVKKIKRSYKSTKASEELSDYMVT